MSTRLMSKFIKFSTSLFAYRNLLLSSHPFINIVMANIESNEKKPFLLLSIYSIAPSYGADQNILNMTHKHNCNAKY